MKKQSELGQIKVCLSFFFMGKLETLFTLFTALEVSDKVPRGQGPDLTFTGLFMMKKIMMLTDDDDDDDDSPKQKKTVSTLSQIEHSAFH